MWVLVSWMGDIVLVMFLILAGLLVIIFLADYVDKSRAKRVAQRNEDTIRSNMEELAQAIYTEICNYCKRNNLTMDSITRIDASIYFTWVYYDRHNNIKQEIKYETLGYRVNSTGEKIMGQKNFWLQTALVKLIGENQWAVISSQSWSKYEDKSKTIIREDGYGAIIASHPTEYYDKIDSRIVSREEYEKFQHQQKKSLPQRPIKTL